MDPHETPDPVEADSQEGGAMADVRAATRALNEALGALTRSVTEASVRTNQHWCPTDA